MQLRNVDIPGPLFVHFKGVLSFNQLWKALQDWLDEKFYRWEESDFKQSFWPEGIEVEGVLKGERLITPFYKFEIKIGMHIWQMKDVKINEEMLQSMRMQLSFVGKLILDPDELWNRPLLRELFVVYVKTLKKKRN